VTEEKTSESEEGIISESEARKKPKTSVTEVKIVYRYTLHPNSFNTVDM
jgi:hypothetical protein